MSERYEPVWFTTEGVPPRRRAEAVAEAFARLIGDVAIDFPLRPRRPVRMVHCALPGALITTCIELRAHLRLGEGVTGGDVVLARPVGGAIRVRQGGREAVVVERDATLISLGQPFEIDATGAERFDFLRIAAPAVARRPALAPGLLQPALATDNRLVLLTHYAGALLQGMIPLDTERHARLAGNHLRDLAGTLFGLDEPVDAALSPAVRLAAVKEQVEREFMRRDLSVETVAQSQGVTSRYVQKLFAGEGTTFTRYLLERRLDAAHAALRGAGRGAIGAIAFDTGFGDLSYFIRSFRRRFGVPPSQVARASGATPDSDRP